LAPGGGEAIKQLISELEDLERFWDKALGAFKRYLEDNH
jgi:hypothetical protein